MPDLPIRDCSTCRWDLDEDYCDHPEVEHECSDGITGYMLKWEPKADGDFFESRYDITHPMTHPFDLMFTRLIEMGDILLHTLDYSGDGWETLHYELEAAKLTQLKRMQLVKTDELVREMGYVKQSEKQQFKVTMGIVDELRKINKDIVCCAMCKFCEPVECAAPEGYPVDVIDYEYDCEHTDHPFHLTQNIMKHKCENWVYRLQK